MQAVGCHVFAGGFTMGFTKVMEVIGQVERHNFGRETVETHLKIPFVNADNWEDWPDVKGCQVCFGNPRCTGFSLVTSGHDETVHGPWAACTQDIHELCKFGIKNDIPLIIWESVQQAFTTGRPLLDYLRDKYFVPAGYRIAHMFLNAASFGNSQLRKRYFFVAYKGRRGFNFEPPVLPMKQTLVGDVLGPLIDVETSETYDGRTYGPDTYSRLSAEDKALLPYIHEGDSKHDPFKNDWEEARQVAPISRMKWDERISEMPFSMHCVRRLDWNWCAPTLFSACRSFIHPRLDRTITVREAARIMGWPEGVVPEGEKPFAQICKGICPEVGEWLAHQCVRFLNDDWGDDDWESTWNHKTLRWEGQSSHGQVEKVLHLGNYVPDFPEKTAYRRERATH